MFELKTKPLFNPNGDTQAVDQKLIGGNPTNICDSINVKYPWADRLYKRLRDNFWIPEKLPMGDDKLSYNLLSENERSIFDKTLSYLVFLDSIQELSLPRIQEYITCREINHLFNQHTMQEGLHIDSYKYIIKSVIPLERRDEVFNNWKICSELRDRNKIITDAFDRFRLNKTEDTLRDAIVYTYFLEGMFFWMGFKFFYLLCSQHKMVATATQIAYINRDEETHCVFFENLINSLRREKALSFEPSEIYPLVEEIVEGELEWDYYLFGDNTLGFDKHSIEVYIKHLANKRLKKIGLKPLYKEEKYKENPFKHLEHNSFNHEGAEKTNFFEGVVIEYTQASEFSEDDWDDI